MSKFITKTAILVLLTSSNLAVSYLHGCRNPGLAFGDYSKFNRVRAALESIDGVTVEQTWVHQDVTQENFGFYIRINNSQPLHLIFQQDNRLKNLRGARLVEELKNMIKAKAVWII
ncbi:MAG: hypothetical protein AMJ79_14335 [Phycisphaerae bacterium SM23_30]|nr:MAG: hypothetical protein AMJ79_14335 [Phycisphaerae bacterium SM23_30]